MLRNVRLLTAALACLIACQEERKDVSPKKGEESMAIAITSKVFEEGGMIPKQYTCDGTDESPPLSWSGIPEGAKSLALICDDPDAPMGTWVHWVLYNLPPDTKELPEGVQSVEIFQSGARHGITDFKRFGYGGPCPPSGTHRYFFKLYALDTTLELSGHVTKRDLLNAMEGHVLASGQLMGKYRRQ
jgi:hypothetical protein